MADRLRVLIVEDDKYVLYYYGNILGQAFEVESAMTVADGLARLKKSAAPDALVLDLHLPNGKGLGLIPTFREVMGMAPIVAVSGYEFALSEVIKAGATDFLRKPFTSPNDLLEALAKAIARPRVAREFAATREGVEALSAKVG